MIEKPASAIFRLPLGNPCEVRKVRNSKPIITGFFVPTLSGHVLGSVPSGNGKSGIREMLGTRCVTDTYVTPRPAVDGGDGIVRSMPVFLVRRRSAATPCVAPASGLSPAGPSAMGSSDSIPATAAECDLSDNPNHGHWLRCQAPAVGLRPSFWGENPSRWCLLCWPSLCSRSPDLFSMGIRVFGFFNKDQRVEYKSQNN